MKLLFILFPGNQVIKKEWDWIGYDNKKHQSITNDFIKKINKMGDIYFYEPTYYNLNHYNKGHEKWFKDDNIDFTKDDIDVDKVCAKIYNDIKDFDGKLVPLGHSIGAYFVYHFAQKYSSKCLFGVIIDGMFINTSNNKLINKNYKKNNKKYSKYTNEQIKNLTDKLKNNDINDKEANKKIIRELSDMYFIHIANYEKQIKKNMKFKIPMISFYNYHTDCNNKINKTLNECTLSDVEFIRKYNDDKKYKIITFLDKTHFPHHVEESKNIILDNITMMIHKYK